MEVSLSPAILGQIGPISITNTMFSTIACSAMLITFALIMRTRWSLIPGRTQMMLEMLIELIMDKMTMAYGSEERARKYFPLFFTIFIFLLLANNLTWIPFIETIINGDKTKLFTTPGAHYSLPIALALFMLGAAHLIAFTISPIRHIGNFIKIGPFIQGLLAFSPSKMMMGLVDIFLGLLDIVGEIAKIISLSTRLFGNMMAGGVIIGIISSLSFYTQFFVPIPFLVLGILTGFVQAFVFTMLGLLFTAGTVNAVRIPQEQEAQ